MALAQSGRALNNIQMDSNTVATSSGGLLNTRISDISLLSKASRAYQREVLIRHFGNELSESRNLTVKNYIVYVCMRTV